MLIILIVKMIRPVDVFSDVLVFLDIDWDERRNGMLN
jgi:hypothetical protein